MTTLTRVVVKLALRGYFCALALVPNLLNDTRCYSHTNSAPIAFHLLLNNIRLEEESQLAQSQAFGLVF